MALYVEVDGPIESRSVPMEGGASRIVYSQPAILLEDGERGNVMFEMSIDGPESALSVGTRYELSVRSFQPGKYSKLELKPYGLKVRKADEKPSKAGGAS